MDEYRVDELNKIKMQESISDIRFLKKSTKEDKKRRINYGKNRFYRRVYFY